MAIRGTEGYGLFERTDGIEDREILYSTEGRLLKGGILRQGEGLVRAGTLLAVDPASKKWLVYDNTAAVNEVQTATISGTPTGGTFALGFTPVAGGDVLVTTPLAHNAPSADVRAALEALSNVGEGNVTVSGSAGGPYTITFVNGLGSRDVPLVTLANNSLTGGSSPSVTIAQTTAGVAGGQVAAGICANDIDVSERDEAVNIYFKGVFKTSELIGLDGDAITALSIKQNADYGWSRIG